jgi:hypothetical protein
MKRHHALLFGAAWGFCAGIHAAFAFVSCVEGAPGTALVFSVAFVIVVSVLVGAFVIEKRREPLP